jgi:HD-GYP domain-containing protein (c-di-GMP phosphodiesterase class II)
MLEGRPVLRGAGAGPRDGDLCAAAVPLSGENEPIGALVAVQIGTGEPFDARRVDALATLAALASVSLRNADLRDAQRNFFAHMTELVVTALDAHLRQQRGHGDRVAKFANRVGRELELTERQLQRLHFSSLLHDIGMLRIDRPLLETEKAFVQHPRIGARMLEQIRLWQDLAPVVLHHHERFDGTGYPEGLAGDAIPLEARIIAVCEAFDVMVSQATYKSTKSLPEAVAELERCAGSQFDPEIVRTFLGLVERGVIEHASD